MKFFKSMNKQPNYYEEKVKPLTRIQPWEKWFMEQQSEGVLKKAEADFKLKKPSYDFNIDYAPLPNGMHMERRDVQYRLVTTSGKEWSSGDDMFLEDQEQVDIEMQNTHTLAEVQSRDRRMVELTTLVPRGEALERKPVASVEIET